jgi:hypothetical protein
VTRAGRASGVGRVCAARARGRGAVQGYALRAALPEHLSSELWLGCLRRGSAIVPAAREWRRRIRTVTPVDSRELTFPISVSVTVRDPVITFTDPRSVSVMQVATS